ncbi:TonB-dependent receptor domain-containing protein [Sphingomonas jeddahensis]|nr:TonB-dependent receptor [Sphingomonas jeddahensis]
MHADAQEAATAADTQAEARTPDQVLQPVEEAPETAASSSAGTADLSDIIVTGSRVLRDGGASPTPVTVVAAEQLQLAAPGNVADGLNQLPAFRGSSRPQTAGAINLATSGGGGNFLNLRNLGVQRTLTLLDGRRAPPSATTGATDVNLLPQLLIQRVDTVTGGASAAYGSDAVAGVVNFVLDRNLTGLRTEVQAGISTRGDGGSQKVALAGGTSFADGRGHLLLSGEYANSDPIERYEGRDWALLGAGIIPNTAGGATQIRATNVNLNIAANGGRIVTVRRPNGTAIAGDPLTNFEFANAASGGGLDPFVAGTNRSAQFQQGGDGARQSTSISGGLQRSNFFGRASYELADNVTVFAEGIYGRSRSRFKILPSFNYNATAYQIYNGNPFIPADLQRIIDTRNSDADTTNDIGSFAVGRLNSDFPPITADILTRTWRGLGGFEATFGDWEVGGYFSHAESRVRQAYHNNPIYSRVAAAADVVRAADGSITCRAQPVPQGPVGVVSPPCVPLNILGSGSPSQAALGYVLGTNVSDLTYKQDVAAINISGTPFATWAGDVSIGFGAEARQESAAVTVDALSTAVPNFTGVRGLNVTGGTGNYQIGNAQPIAGRNTVREAYVEAAVPLLKESAIGHALDINGAVRYADYDRGGGVTTWKIGGVYEPVEGVRLRATRSRDIRAANIGELFGVGSQNQGTVIQPNGTTISYISYSGGNPDLVPETADTFTAGIALQPRALPGFTATVDYYNIEIGGVIGSLTAQQTYDQCAAGSALACSNVVATPTRLTISTRQLNLNRLETRGVDVELGWRGDVAGGQLSTRLLLGYLDKYVLSVPGAAPIDYTGEVGQLNANPKWTGVFSVNYDNGPIGLFVQERYIHKGVYNSTLVEGVTVNDNSVPARWYTDATIRFTLEDNASKPQLFVTANNLFDRDPPIAPYALGTIFRATNPLLYDVVGRYVTAGFRFRF